MLDYKEGIQAIFEDLCDERHGCEYWKLDDETQYKLYTEASSMYFDKMADYADYHRKAERERQ